jgi:hypothetical protein
MRLRSARTRLLGLPSDVVLEICEWAGTDLEGKTSKTLVSWFDEYKVDFLVFIVFDKHGSYVRTVKGTKHLRSLTLCCRKLNKVASTVLGRSFAHTGTTALPMFSQLVLRNPDRGKRSKHFSTKGFWETSMSHFKNADYTLASGAMKEFYFASSLPALKIIKEFAHMMVELRAGSSNPMVGLLLSLLPSLESLELDGWWMNSPEAIQVLLRSHPDTAVVGATLPHETPKRWLSCLNSVSFMPESPVLKHRLYDFLLIPTLRKLKFQSLQTVNFAEPLPSNNLTSLQLYSCSMGQYIGGVGNVEWMFHDFMRFMQNFPNLSKFHYDHRLKYDDSFRPPYGYPSVSGYSMDHMKRAICGLRHTLEDLLLVHTCKVFSPDGMGDLLAGFEKLHMLVIQKRTLLGPLEEVDGGRHGEYPLGLEDKRPINLKTHIPKSLKRLVLIGVNEEIIEELHLIAANKGKMAPSLEAISISYEDRRPNVEDLVFKGYGTEFGEICEDCIRLLKEDCLKAGIWLSISRGSDGEQKKREYWHYT